MQPTRILISAVLIWALLSGLDLLIGKPLVANSYTTYYDSIDGPVFDVSDTPAGGILMTGDFGEKIVVVAKDGSIEKNAADEAPANRPGHAIACTKDGGIVIGGEFTYYEDALVGYIAKLHEDGSLDTDFARNIGSGFDEPVYAVAPGRDGKVYVGGEFHTFDGQPAKYLVRLNADGTLDKTYQPDGPVYDLEWVSEFHILAISGDFNRIEPFESRGFLIANLEELAQ